MKRFTKRMMSLLVVIIVIFTAICWTPPQKAKAAALDGTYYKATTRFGCGILSIELQEDPDGNGYLCQLQVSPDGSDSKTVYISIIGLHKVKKNTWKSKSIYMNGKETKKITYTLKRTKGDIIIRVKQKKKVTPFSKYNPYVDGYYSKG